MSKSKLDSNVQYHTFALELLEKLDLSNVTKVLDAGCGVGLQSKWFVEQGVSEVKSIDLTNRLWFDDLDFVQADILNAPFADHYFDGIWSHHVIEHVPNPILYLIKLRTLLASSGQLWITVPQIDSVISSGHINSYTISMLVYHLAMAGFDCRAGKFTKQRSHLRAIVSPSTQYLPMSIGDVEFALSGLSKMDLFPDEIKRVYLDTGRIDNNLVDVAKLWGN